MVPNFAGSLVNTLTHPQIVLCALFNFQARLRKCHLCDAEELVWKANHIMEQHTEALELLANEMQQTTI